MGRIRLSFNRRYWRRRWIHCLTRNRPLGIALAAVSVLGWIFSDSKEEKIRKAKAKLREDLTQPSFEMLGKMHDQIIDIFNNDILNKGIDEFSDMLGDYAHMLARLGQSQSSMAATLFDKFSDLNAKILEEAISYKGAGFISSVDEIARVPGETMVAFADRSSLNTNELSDLLGEKILVTRAGKDLPETLKNILNSDFDVDFYPLDYDTEDAEAERAVAVFPQKKIDATKFKIAQQIAGVPIIAEFTQPQSSTQSTRYDNPPQTTSSDDAFESDFKRIDQMFTKGESNFAIRNALDALRRRAKNLRNAKAMRKIADYYDKALDSGTAVACREEAKTFTSATNNSNSNTTPSGERTQNNDFSADFKRIDQMFAKGESHYFIRDALVSLRQRARNLRNAVAMRKIADYYEKIYDSGTGYECRREANDF